MKIIRDGYGYIELSDLLILDALGYTLPDEYGFILNSNYRSTSRYNGFFKIINMDFLRDVSLMDFIPDFEYLSSLSLVDLIALYNSSLNDAKAYDAILNNEKHNNKIFPTKIYSVKSNHKVNSYNKFIGYYCGNIKYSIPDDIDINYSNKKSFSLSS